MNDINCMECDTKTQFTKIGGAQCQRIVIIDQNESNENVRLKYKAKKKPVSAKEM